MIWMTEVEIKVENKGRPRASLLLPGSKFKNAVGKMRSHKFHTVDNHCDQFLLEHRQVTSNNTEDWGARDFWVRLNIYDRKCHLCLKTIKKIEPSENCSKTTTVSVSQQ